MRFWSQHKTTTNKQTQMYISNERAKERGRGRNGVWNKINVTDDTRKTEWAFEPKSLFMTIFVVLMFASVDPFCTLFLSLLFHCHFTRTFPSRFMCALVCLGGLVNKRITHTRIQRKIHTTNFAILLFNERFISQWYFPFLFWCHC